MSCGRSYNDDFASFKNRPQILGEHTTVSKLWNNILRELEGVEMDNIQGT